jgi:hypothetical protein
VGVQDRHVGLRLVPDSATSAVVPADASGHDGDAGLATGQHRAIRCQAGPLNDHSLTRGTPRPTEPLAVMIASVSGAAVPAGRRHPIRTGVGGRWADGRGATLGDLQPKRMTSAGPTGRQMTGSSSPWWRAAAGSAASWRAGRHAVMVIRPAPAGGRRERRPASTGRAGAATLIDHRSPLPVSQTRRPRLQVSPDLSRVTSYLAQLRR